MKNFKKFISTAILISIMMPASIFAAGKLPPSASNQTISINFNGVVKNPSQDMGSPYFDVNTNRTMVPIRFVAEELGLSINYVQKSETFPEGGFVLGGKNLFISLKSNSNIATVHKGDSEKTITLDASSIVYDGRTYVPIRFISETLGYNVDWKNNTVFITKKNDISEDSKKDSDKNKELENKKIEERLNFKDYNNKDNRLSYNDYNNGRDIRKTYNTEVITVGNPSYFISMNNDYRASKGISALVEDQELNRVARIRAEEELRQYISTRDIDHESESGVNHNMWENVTAFYDTSGKAKSDIDSYALNGWQNSPGHNANLLDPAASKIGYSYVTKVVDGTIYGAGAMVMTY